jgi:hypothetical protein
MAVIDRAKDKQKNLIPGAYAFACDCGYTGRTVIDAEVWFTCERPVEPKVPPCKIIHNLPRLIEQLEMKEKRKDAEEFVATHDDKLAEARRIIAEVPAEPKKLKRGPKR